MVWDSNRIHKLYYYCIKQVIAIFAYLFSYERNMGKLTALLIALLSVWSSGLSQDIYNKWSVDGNFGVNSVMGEFADGYMSNSIGFFHGDIGGRYMHTNLFGFGFHLGMDRVKHDEVGNNGFLFNQDSKPFETHYFRTQAEMFINIGRLIEIDNLHEDIGMLLHTGVGFASLKDSKNSVWFKNWKNQGTDQMLNYMIGVRPQYNLDDRYSVHMDVSMAFNYYQSKTWDFTENNFKKDVHGKVFSLSFGISVYLGEHDKHLDWVIVPKGGSTYNGNDTIRKIETIRTIETIRVKGEGEHFKKDSVETEKREPENDFDGDGVPNDKDLCPTTPGDELNGCPSSDRDGDGVRNDIDDCPDQAGSRTTGCPDIPLEVKIVLNDAMRSVNFRPSNDIIEDTSYQYLDEVVEIMNEHPEYYMLVEGNTDNQGAEGPLMNLSVKRAEKVVEYLVEKGISKDRLKAVGHGGNNPIASNQHPEGRKQNERVEFTVKFNAQFR